MLFTLTRLWNKWLAGSHGRATGTDVYYCYRFFLNREPDPAGWKIWMRILWGHRVAGKPMTLKQLKHRFLHSLEHLNLQNEERRQRGEPQLVELDDFRIWVRLDDHAVGAEVARHRVYEPYVAEALRPLFRPGTHFLDVGANIGYFTLMAAARVGPQGKVVAVEPNPDNCDLLTRSLQTNRFTNVEVLPYAAADREQTFKVCPDESNSTSLVLDHDPGAASPFQSSYLVKAVVLDEALKDLPRLDVVKIDIDGGEPRALRGMERLLRRHRPILFLEYAPQLLQTLSRIDPVAFLDQLDQLGYDLYILDRSQGKSAAAQSRQQIVDAYYRSGITHLDLQACPREVGRAAQAA